MWLQMKRNKIWHSFVLTNDALRVSVFSYLVNMYYIMASRQG